LMADAYTQVDSQGELIGKQQILASFQAEKRYWQQAESDEYHVRIHGDVAVVLGRWRAKGVNAGQSFDYAARYVAVWVFQNNRWQMVSDQSTEIPRDPMKTFTLPAIPGEFQWHVLPVDWSFDPASGLSIVAGAQTDWFSDPAGDFVKDNAPCALMTPTDAHFLLSAKVAVAFGATYDAGVLQIRARDDLGAKLCFEYSPRGRHMIVSVVTRGVSDDCNSVEIDGSEVYLRVARTPQTVAFHYSLDGRVWHLVRYFSLGQADTVRVGFSAQSPTGQQCAAAFSEVNYRAGVLKDIRNGE